MSIKNIAIASALVTLIAAPVPAWAFGGGIGGCSDLPEVYRAQGALEGMTSACDMSVEQARRILAAQGGAAYQQVAPAPIVRHRRHRVPLSEQ